MMTVAANASARDRSAYQRLLDVLLTTNPVQRTCLVMSGLAALLMTVCIVIMHIVAAAGLANPRYVIWWTLACVGGLTGVLVLIRTGLSRRFRDPSLTLFQMLYAIACNAVAYVIAGQARGITVPILAVIVMFGMFGLTARQMLGVMFYALGAFSLAGLLVEWRQEPGGSLALSAANAIMNFVVLISSTFLTRRVQAARDRLHGQKLALAQALEQIRELAMHDDLTRLPNRRYMLELMRLEILRSERSGHSLLLALLDLDHFKAINDNYGHAVGDLALQAFADTVRSCVRGSDVVARWGGEEFVLMLCNIQPDDAQDLLERVRHAVESLRINRPDTPPIQLTLSTGLAYHQPGEAVEGTLERADRALYMAKSGGRNRVAWAQ